MSSPESAPDSAQPEPPLSGRSVESTPAYPEYVAPNVQTWTKANAEFTDLQASYDFLMTGRAAGGVLFNFSNAPQLEPGRERSLAAQGIPNGLYALPGSYLDTAAYWGAYVCGGSRATCAIKTIP